MTNDFRGIKDIKDVAWYKNNMFSTGAVFREMELRRRKKDEEKQVTEEKIKQMQVSCST